MINPIELTTLQKVNLAQKACSDGVRFCVANGHLKEANDIARRVDKMVESLSPMPHKDAVAAALVLVLAKLMAQIENDTGLKNKLTRLPEL